MLMTQQRFKVTANGFVELNGSITVELTKNTTFGVNPGMRKTITRLGGNGKQENVNCSKLNINCWHSYHSITCGSTVQFSTTSPDNVKRTNEVMAVVDVMKRRRICKSIEYGT